MAKVERKLELQEKLARESAEGAITSFCVPHKTQGRSWYEPTEDQEAPEYLWVQEAIEYLRILESIEDHPKRDWIRVLVAE